LCIIFFPVCKELRHFFGMLFVLTLLKIAQKYTKTSVKIQKRKAGSS